MFNPLILIAFCFVQHLDEASMVEYEIKQPKVGEFCCARYTEDQSWFRAKILSVKEQSNVTPPLYYD